MALAFRKVERLVIGGEDKGKTKTYAVPHSGTCDMEKLCKLISARSAMSSGDVKSILDCLNWAMDLELQSGNIVQLGEFGNFRLSIRSKGVEGKEEFKASDIKRAKLVFTPGKSLRESVSSISFVYDKPQVEVTTEECNEPHAI